MLIMRKLQILLPMLLMASMSFAQQKIITGKIIIKSNRSPNRRSQRKCSNKTVSTDKSGYSR